ncbi:Crp/Fnr family transcriptional regulator [Ferruginibacter sp. SUN106]|uniref:Crp/Fnr family transcriptional regulator n=1 Tax=Ferruginibacter sp. SUN106 TaxID=2978348 RepID=UPI003D35A803
MNFFFEEYPLSKKTISNLYKEKNYAYCCLVDLLVFLGVNDIEDPMSLKSFFKFTKIEKDTILLAENHMADKLLYIAKGAIKNTITVMGKEQVFLLLSEGNFVTGFDSFMNQSISKSNIITTEDSVLLEISYKDFLELLLLYPQLQIAIDNAKYIFMRFLQEMAVMSKFESKQRYEFLLSKMPQITNRFQLKYQASFLGMKPETLSRIRNEIAKKQ